MGRKAHLVHLLYVDALLVHIVFQDELLQVEEGALVARVLPHLHRPLQSKQAGALVRDPTSKQARSSMADHNYF